MTATDGIHQAGRILKERHRAMWALGDYPSVAADVIPGLGAALVEACRVEGGKRVLDVAAGCGNAAIPAAALGAHVVACDLTPELLEAGRGLADKRGVRLEWREGDAEALPFGDDEFDVVLSCVGVMFAPNHETCAKELARVCRPGGTLGLVSWTPEGFVGEMLSVMMLYVPPPPGGQPPTQWGSEDYLQSLFGHRVDWLLVRRQSVTVDRFSTPEDFCNYFKTHYGPMVAAYRSLAGDRERMAALDWDLTELARRHDRGSGPMVLDWEYLLAAARVRP